MRKSSFRYCSIILANLSQVWYERTHPLTDPSKFSDVPFASRGPSLGFFRVPRRGAAGAAGRAEALRALLGGREPRALFGARVAAD